MNQQKRCDMKFVAITLVKDESDIIELYVRINARVIDHFIIIDNGSCDSTLEILSKLRDEGFNITLFKDPNIDYQQSAMTTKALRSAFTLGKFDWAFMIDADEFICIDRQKLEDELKNIPRNNIASLEWVTWIPKGNNFYEYSNPLWSCFNRRKKEYQYYEKVIIPYELANNVILAEGNHTAFSHFEGIGSEFGKIDIKRHCLKCGVLDHVPVRSDMQIITKALIGSHKLSIKPNRLPDQGFHWDNIAELIRKAHYQVDDLLLRYIALGYTARKNDEVVDDVDENSKLGFETDVIKYRDLTIINDRLRYDIFMALLGNTVRALHKKQK